MRVLIEGVEMLILIKGVSPIKLDGSNKSCLNVVFWIGFIILGRKGYRLGG